MIRAVLSALLALSFSAPAMAQSLEQMAGQMIIVGFKGDDVGDASVKAVRDEIAAGTLGGVMYLKPNVKSLAAVKAMNAAFRAASPRFVLLWHRAQYLRSSPEPPCRS